MHKLEPLLPFIAAIPGDILAKEQHLKATLSLKTRVIGNCLRELLPSPAAGP